MISLSSCIGMFLSAHLELHKDKLASRDAFWVKMLQEKTETQQRQRKTSLGSQRDLRASRERYLWSGRGQADGATCCRWRFRLGNFIRPQSSQRCRVQLHPPLNHTQALPARLIPTISRGELAGRGQELPQAQLFAVPEPGVPRPLATPHCPWQDVLSPSFPSPHDPCCLLLTVQAHSPGPF